MLEVATSGFERLRDGAQGLKWPQSERGKPLGMKFSGLWF
jgi:hypothetical protein